MTRVLPIKFSLHLLFVFFLFCSTASAQLVDFTLSVSPTNESCTQNGTLTFTVGSTTAGASIVFSVYKLPNTTVPVAVGGNTLVSGLQSGDYLVIAVQSLGAQSNSQQQQVTIIDTIVDLDYTLSQLPERCGNDGKITVNVTEGVAVWYEIFAGPVLRPLQPSNVFSNLPGGTYTVRVFDNCGEGLVGNVIVNSTPAGLTIQDGSTPLGNTCNTFELHPAFGATPGTAIAWPLNISITVVPPVGAPLSFNFPVSTSEPVIPIPTYFQQPYTYNVTVIDACGNSYVRNDIPIVLDVNPVLTLTPSPVGCNGQALDFAVVDMIPPIAITFTSAPAGFSPLSYNFNTIEGTIYTSPTTPMPSGSYTAVSTDSCGNTATTTIVILPPNPPALVSVTNLPACELGFGSIRIVGVGSAIVNIVMTAAPSGYPVTAPHDFTQNLLLDALSLGPMIQGNYSFTIINECGETIVQPVTVTGYQAGATTGLVTENCDSFNFRFDHETNAGAGYWLQKLDPVTNLWGHPYTGNVGAPNNFGTSNAIPVSNHQTLHNIDASGVFRVVKVHSHFLDFSATLQRCITVIYNFEYYGGPKIIDLYSFSCDNGTYDAIIVATGLAPLTYRITLKDGLPFIVNNGNSSLFLALEPAIYNFQVEDGCGNILNSQLDIGNPSLFPIIAATTCDGEPASLTIPGFPFFDYQWWKGDNQSVILSTSNTLDFSAFNNATDAGLYHVRVFYAGNANSCVDFIVDYEININSTIAQAGTGQSVTYCGTQGNIDLFSLLSGTYDLDGTWQELSGSGQLSDNIWNSTQAGIGNFQFKYTVTGECNTAQSIIAISLNAIPEVPIASLQEPPCNLGTLNLYATTINGSYQWSGPNGFTSNQQNPVIENISVANSGTYTVKSFSNSCESATSSVQVVITPLPEFALTSECLNKQFTVTAVFDEGAFDPDDVNYSWTGPENYSGSGNPIIITGKPNGLYSVTLTTPEGCSKTESIEIAGTLCEVPKGVSPNNDGNNDSFDLTGLGIDELKIFNRYGMVVYEQVNYVDQWNGQDFKGRELPSSTYYYLLSMPTGEIKSGWVYLQRKE